MAPVTVAIKRLPEGEGLPLPRYMSEDAAGADLCAAVFEDLTLQPGARAGSNRICDRAAVRI